MQLPDEITRYLEEHYPTTAVRLKLIDMALDAAEAVMEAVADGVQGNLDIHLMLIDAATKSERYREMDEARIYEAYRATGLEVPKWLHHRGEIHAELLRRELALGRHHLEEAEALMEAMGIKV